MRTVFRTDELECLALTLCAPGSALAGVSSLVHDRLTGFESSVVHIVLPEGADKPDSDGLPPGLELVTHWSTDLGADDVHPLREPRQTKLQTPAGRYYLDATWDQLDLTVEVHGSQHQQVRSWDADLRRGNEVAFDGRRQLVFTSYAICHEKQQVAGQLLRMFRSLGWHPPATEDEGFG